MKINSLFLFTGLFIIFSSVTHAQIQSVDAHSKLYLSPSDYKTPYGVTTPDEVKELMDRILIFLEKATPTGVFDKDTGKQIFDYAHIDHHSIISKGTFSLTNYMWGVTYSSMLAAATVTGDFRYRDYVEKRFRFLSEVEPYFLKTLSKDDDEVDPQIRQMLRPAALDDAGAMCNAMIKATLENINVDCGSIINRYMDYIMYREYRLHDGTFARNRPQRNSVWLDDMYMSVPAIAYMGKLTGDAKYYDEAVKQVLQMAKLLFLPEKGLYRHGWIEAMQPHPDYHWGRANGWALMAKAELLDALPENHPGYKKVLSLFQEHVAGLIKYQSGDGFWHQLLDRNDSYLETSCTAIYTYCLAHAINRGWINAQTYGPPAMLGWHAVTTKVNGQGEVEGTCVGTGMGFDPAFYYYRPVNKYAAHGYGPVLSAGTEIFRLLSQFHIKMNDSALLFYDQKIDTEEPIFYVGYFTGAPEKEFDQYSKLSWHLVFEDNFQSAKKPEWVLDGKKGIIRYDNKGMELCAGHEALNDSNHVVLWSPCSFSGDLKIEYSFTRLDTSSTESVNIIYLHALGSGNSPYVADIKQWNRLRDVPSMQVYYNHMNTYHISYAVNGPEGIDYIRARRYIPETVHGLSGTALFPEYHDTKLFQPGITYQITIILHNRHLFMHVTDNNESHLFWFDTASLPPLYEGYIGLRQMGTRVSRYADFRVSTLVPKN